VKHVIDKGATKRTLLLEGGIMKSRWSLYLLIVFFHWRFYPQRFRLSQERSLEKPTTMMMMTSSNTRLLPA